MKRIEKVFIGIGVILILLVSAGIYVNYQLDHLVASLNRPGLLFRDVGPGEIEGSGDGMGTGTETGTGLAPGEPGYRPPGVSSGGQSGQSSSTGVAGSEEDQTSNAKIAGDVQSKIDKPLEKGDLIKAGLIILRKLDSDEISFLYNVGKQDSYTAEELKRTRAILLKKLSAEDVKTLRQLGAKYGKPLHVLDPSYEIN